MRPPAPRRAPAEPDPGLTPEQIAILELDDRVAALERERLAAPAPPPGKEGA